MEGVKLSAKMSVIAHISNGEYGDDGDAKKIFLTQLKGHYLDNPDDNVFK